MSGNLEEQLKARPWVTDSYERAFVRTALRLFGIEGIPTSEQWDIAKRTLDLYDLKAAVERFSHSEADTRTSASEPSPMDGVERAFMLIRFESTLPPDEQQRQELNEWLDADFLIRLQVMGPPLQK